MINIALWVAGVALLVLGVWRVRRPYARMNELDQLAENAKRYESWRGNRSTADRPTGADDMRQLLRRQVITWALIAGVGVVLIVAGFAIR